MKEARSSGCRRPGLVAVGLALLALVTPLSHVRADVCPGRYTVSADGATVTDNDTHLVWQRDVNVGDGPLCSPSIAKGCYSWTAAKHYCMTLPIAGGGWRLPHVFELLTIVDESQHEPAITLGSTAFSNPPLDFPYWTSSPLADGPLPGAVWAVTFYFGGMVYDLPSTRFRVRCVR